MAIQIWFLYPGGPDKKSSLRTFFTDQLHDPVIAQTLPSFLRFFWVWWLVYLRNKTPLLTGPCLSFEAANEHAQEFIRLIGPDFRCTPIHHFGSTDLEYSLKELPKKSKVVLLPMIPHRCRTLYSALERCRTASQHT